MAASPWWSDSFARSKTAIPAALSKNPFDQFPDEVEVTDPTHPLFGRRFKVHSITRSDASSARVLVIYRGDIRLAIPRGVTNFSLLDRVEPRARLSAEAVREFLSLVKEYELCPSNPVPSGGV